MLRTETLAFRVVAGGLVLLLVAGAVLAGILALRPPSELTLAAGPEGGAYTTIAARYRSAFARDDLDLAIRETAGSGENAVLINDPESGVGAAILQGGVSAPAEWEGVETLAAVFVEPLWIFHTGALPAEASLADFEGLRVAAGGVGSGTRAALLSILAALGLGPDDVALEPLGGADAAAALLIGDVDVAMFVAPAGAPYLKALIADPAVQLKSLPYADAIARRVEGVDLVTLPAGGLDYRDKIPPENVAMLGMVARIVIRADLHPAHVNRLVTVARRVHGHSDVFADLGAYPAWAEAGPPMNSQAAAMIDAGERWTDRTLPYWMAAQVNRVALLLLPLVLLTMPVLRALPGLYSWRMRSRIYRNYRELLALEAEATTAASDADRARMMAKLDRIEEQVLNTRVPMHYHELAYTLRMHIDMIRRRLAPTHPAE